MDLTLNPKRLCQISVPFLAFSMVEAASSSQQNRESWVPQRKFTDRIQNIESSYFDQQPLVHTFETQSSCLRRCTLSCVMQNVEDLMMPRWICPSQQSSELTAPSTLTEPTDYLSAFDNQLLLLIIPIVLIGFIAIIILLIRRRSRLDDELV